MGYAYQLPALLLLLLCFGLSDQQQDQNNYFFSQQQGRFAPSSFQNSRNGFFANENVQQQQNAPGSYHEQRLYLGGDEQQQDTTDGYFPFSSFAPRQADYYEISPRPFTVQTPSNNGIYVRPPPRPSSGYQQNRNVYQETSQQQQQQLIDPYADNIRQQQPDLNEPITEKPFGLPQSQRSRQFASHKNVQQTGFIPTVAVPQQAVQSSTNDQQNNKFYRNQPNSKKPNEYVTSHESSLRSRNRFQPIGYSSSTPAATVAASTTRKVRFNPWRSTTVASLVPVAEAQIINAHGLQSLPRQPLYGNKERGVSITTNNVRQSFDTASVTTNKKNEDELDDDNTKDILDDIDDYYYDNEKETIKEPVRETLPNDSSINPVDFVKQNSELVDKATGKNSDDVKQSSKTETEQKRNVEVTESPVEKEDTKEDGPVILHSNFYLPESTGNKEEFDEEIEDEDTDQVYPTRSVAKPTIDPGYEYEYEYEDFEEQATPVPSSIPHENEDSILDYVETTDEGGTKDARKDEVVGEAVVSVVTTKSVINGSTSNPDDKLEKTNDETELRTSTPDMESISNSTESWVVVASVQTSRSVSGARFLPFPQVEQEEKKQTLSELEESSNEEELESDSVHNEDLTTIPSIESIFDIETTTEPENYPTAFPTTRSTSSTTDHAPNISHSTESIIDKLDRVQSELSSGLLTGKYPILNEQQADLTTTSLPVVIRKFSPRTSTVKSTTTKTTTTTTKAPEKKIEFETLAMDDLSASLLPPGFKPRNNSYRNKKITTTTTTTTTTARPIDELGRSNNVSRSFKSNPNEQDLLAALLPKDYKLNSTPEPILVTNKTKLSELLANIQLEDESPSKKTTKIPFVTVSESVNKFLPPGYKLRTTTPKMPATVKDSVDLSKFLPPGFKLPKEESTTKKPSAFIPVPDDISKFLPSGYKPPAGESIAPAAIPISDDVLSKLLPPGYKAPASEKKPELPKIHKFSDDGSSKESIADSILNKIKFTDVSALLPPGFKPDEEKSVEETPTTTKPTTKTSSGFKVVFPKSLGKRPAPRVTTPKPVHSVGSGHAEGPEQKEVTIRKGFPTRATTEFTGWPSPPTTPISIEEILRQQGAQSIDISELLGQTSTTTTTTTSTTTTTTTTTTVKPTQPGHCHSDCDMAGTIKIIDGVQWTPELLDHNTNEWKTLAKEVEKRLNDVYANSRDLKQWFRKVRIDSFSKGSVLVDYFVELSVPEDRQISTLEMKKMFHEALRVAPMKVEPEYQVDEFEDEDEPLSTSTPKPIVKDTYLLGHFKLDPISTDFIVIPKPILPTVQYAETSFLPQWAIAVIVIGMASLLFVIVFGVSVLVNRQKRSKKRAPQPLTADMLNELNKNHMGGFENYGRDDFYNPEDTWSDTKHPIKPKRFTNSMHGSSSNIYDSWRSQRNHKEQQQPHYYDSHHYPQKGVPYSPNDMYNMDPHHPNAMGMYTYNSRRFPDYDADF